MLGYMRNIRVKNYNRKIKHKKNYLKGSVKMSDELFYMLIMIFWSITIICFAVDKKGFVSKTTKHKINCLKGCKNDL